MVSHDRWKVIMAMWKRIGHFSGEIIAVFAMISTAFSISSSVVKRPRLKRTAPKPYSSPTPIAFNTGDNSLDVSWHAEPRAAAALYAFTKARKKPVVCFALVTNQMGAVEGDFEKGHNQGIEDFLALIRATCEALLPGRKPHA